MLPRALASVLDQAEDVEIIVIDDGSSPANRDAIISVCESDRRIRLLRNEVSSGAPHARNQGLAESRGRYWATLDDDNVWLAGKWEAQRDLFERAQFADDVTAVCAVRLAHETAADPRGIPLAGSQPERCATLSELFRRVPARSFVHSYVAPLARMREIGGYDDRLVWGEHTDVLIRLAKVSRFSGTPVVGVSVEKEHGSERTGRNWERKVEGVSIILDKHREAFAAEPGLRAQYRHILGVSQLRAGDRKAALKTFAGIARDGPGLGRRARAFGHLCIAAIGGAALWRRVSGEARVAPE